MRNFGTAIQTHKLTHIRVSNSLLCEGWGMVPHLGGDLKGRTQSGRGGMPRDSIMTIGLNIIV